MKDEHGRDVGIGLYGFTHAVKAVLRVKAGGELSEYRNERQTRYTVIEQAMQICSGGIKRTVLCRGVVPGGCFHAQVLELHEFELEPAEPFPDENKSDADDADRLPHKEPPPDGNDH